MLSPQSKYALRAVLYLNDVETEGYVRVDQIAREAHMPAPYLAKILKSLAERKIILSRRGKNGGVQINRNRAPVTFFEICDSVEDPIVRSECVLFKRACNKNAPCSFHGEWSQTKARLLDFLERTSLKSSNSQRVRELIK